MEGPQRLACSNVSNCMEGQPPFTLTELNQRIYRKKLYIGNLSENTTLQQISENMQKIYLKNIENGVIDKIETYLNNTGWENDIKRRSQNPNHQVRKSVCVVLSSKPGITLANVGLNLEKYTHQMQRSVRYWNGPIPWPANHPKIKSPLNLTW